MGLAANSYMRPSIDYLGTILGVLAVGTAIVMLIQSYVKRRV